MSQKSSKIVSLSEVRKRSNIIAARDSSKGEARLAAELDYRTDKLLEALDSAYDRIEKLERKVLLLVKVIQDAAP